MEEVPTQRFRGLPPGMRTFYERIDAGSPPASWSGGERVTYVKDVLGTLKSLTRDLRDRLEGTDPPLALEARVGASLARSGDPALGDDRPVRTVRAWAAAADPQSSPLLSVTFTAEAIRLSLSAREPEPLAAFRDLLLGPDEAPRADAATLLSRGWSIECADATTADSLSPGLEPWCGSGPLEVDRLLAWEPWLEEPAFVDEVADRFREALPVFRHLRGRAVTGASGS